LDVLPRPSPQRMALHVRPAAERALRLGHPWLYDASIRDQSREGRPGDLAVVFDRRDRFLAIGLYDPDSPIRVRVLQQGTPATISREWFRERIRRSAALRRPLEVDENTTAYRLVHGENDGLPGLVVDRYSESYVLKLDTAAWLAHLHDVVPALLTEYRPERLVLRFSRSAREALQRHGIDEGCILAGKGIEGPVTFMENGLRFAADLVHGQKTGFFLDQRENRAKVGALIAADTTLRRVLNVFAYTGAFSLYAARAGATRVVSLDVSEPALQSALANFDLNVQWPGVASARHEIAAGDAFELLGRFDEEDKRFDVVIVDPPALARSQADVPVAGRAYRRLAADATRLVRPDGLLVMSSCSSRVTANAFRRLVRQGSRSAGRSLHQLAQTGHPADHPITFPEGDYLKTIYARVT
jgi:23S rRNA (cytosine1962-C5)-methyltransferase